MIMSIEASTKTMKLIVLGFNRDSGPRVGSMANRLKMQIVFATFH